VYLTLSSIDGENVSSDSSEPIAFPMEEFLLGVAHIPLCAAVDGKSKGHTGMEWYTYKDQYRCPRKREERHLKEVKVMNPFSGFVLGQLQIGFAVSLASSTSSTPPSSTGIDLYRSHFKSISKIGRWYLSIREKSRKEKAIDCSSRLSIEQTDEDKLEIQKGGRILEEMDACVLDHSLPSGASDGKSNRDSKDKLQEASNICGIEDSKELETCSVNIDKPMIIKVLSFTEIVRLYILAMKRGE
ncbi:MAG: hypothetical protein AAF388_28270, partial [Bacteroidota bacterium]